MSLIVHPTKGSKSDGSKRFAPTCSTTPPGEKSTSSMSSLLHDNLASVMPTGTFHDNKTESFSPTCIFNSETGNRLCLLPELFSDGNKERARSVCFLCIASDSGLYCNSFPTAFSPIVPILIYKSPCCLLTCAKPKNDRENIPKRSSTFFIGYFFVFAAKIIMFFKESKKSDSFLPMSLKESIIMKTAAQDQKALCGDSNNSN